MCDGNTHHHYDDRFENNHGFSRAIMLYSNKQKMRFKKKQNKTLGALGCSESTISLNSNLPFSIKHINSIRVLSTKVAGASGNFEQLRWMHRGVSDMQGGSEKRK
jgi:hypothetical protein